MGSYKDLKNMTIVITGATSGIGLATAKKLAKRGAFVIGVGRSEQKCTEAEKHIQKIHESSQVKYLTADLSSLLQVRDLACQIGDTVRMNNRNCIDVVVNNAGIFTQWYTSTAEGFECQFCVNHLAPFLLTHELLPLLKTAKFGKVITLSSGSHYRTKINWNDVFMRKHYNCLAAYKQSKLANVLFTMELNRRLKSYSSIRAFAVDPGLVNTDIGIKGNSGTVKWIWEKRRKKGTSPEVPATTIAYLIENPDLHNTPYIYWKNCSPKNPSRYSQREDVAARLWDLSEKICGISMNSK